MTNNRSKAQSLDKRLAAARKALQGGNESVLAYLTGIPVKTIRRLGGVGKST